MDIGLVHFPTPPWPALETYPALHGSRDELGKVILFVGRGAPGDGQTGSDGDTPGGTMRHATKIGKAQVKDHPLDWYLQNLETYKSWPVAGLIVLEPLEYGPRPGRMP